MEKTLTAQQLALYLGCEVVYNEEMATMYGVHTNQVMLSVGDHPHGEICKPSEVKPLLRRLDSMTEEECRDIFDGGLTDTFARQCISEISGSEFELLRWMSKWTGTEGITKLLSKSFDLFGFIDSGLAIDIATLKTE